MTDLTPAAVEALFTRANGEYLFARWGRAIVPVVFGTDDATLQTVKGAIEAVTSPGLMERIWRSVEHTQEVKNVTCTIKPPCLAKVNGKCMYYSKGKR